MPFTSSNTLQIALNLLKECEEKFSHDRKESEIEDNLPKTDLHQRIENYFYRIDNPPPMIEQDCLH